MATVFAEFYGCIDCLKEALLIDTCNDEVALVNSLGTLGRGADAINSVFFSPLRL